MIPILSAFFYGIIVIACVHAATTVDSINTSDAWYEEESTWLSQATIGRPSRLLIRLLN